MTRHHLWLALLLVVVATQLVFTLDVIRSLRGEYPLPPFTVGGQWPSIVYVQPRAHTSGLRAGDHIISIDGRALLGYQDYWHVLHARKPGESLDVIVDRAGQRIRNRRQALACDPAAPLAGLHHLPRASPGSRSHSDPGSPPSAPYDKRAWMMFVILVGIAQLQRAAILNPLGWPAIVGLPATF